MFCSLESSLRSPHVSWSFNRFQEFRNSLRRSNTNLVTSVLQSFRKYAKFSKMKIENLSHSLKTDNSPLK